MIQLKVASISTDSEPHERTTKHKHGADEQEDLQLTRSRRHALEEALLVPLLLSRVEAPRCPCQEVFLSKHLQSQ